MKWISIPLAMAAGSLLAGWATARPQQQERQPQAAQPPTKDQQPAPPAPPNYTLSGPYTHQNLTIFLIHGADAAKGKAPLTLQEALDQKKVVVHETGDVNTLHVENVSDGDEIFIQTGDIVKGGKQDRILAYDLILPAKSGKVPLNSFCCEQGRWRQRGAELASRFDSSTAQVAGKDLKIAVNASRDQSEVWKEVAQQQKRISDNIGKDVRNAASQSSYQLAVEDKDLKKMTDEYTKAFAKTLDDKTDAIGFALVINGKIDSADVYGSADLFRKLWPKLCKTNAVDAIAHNKKDLKFDTAKADAVKAVFAEAGKGKVKEKDVSARIRIYSCDGDKVLMMECRDKTAAGTVWHRCYLTK